jgi:large subunit ribosomal protein L12
MEYIYAALMLHSFGKEISEESITSVVKTAGADVDSVRVKALVSALKEVNIDEAISSAAITPVVTTEVKKEEEKKEEKKEEEKKEEKKEEEEESALEGLGALFG